MRWGLLGNLEKGRCHVFSQRRIGVLLGYANIVVKNLVNLVYTPMLLSFVGQADYGVYQTSNSFVFSLTLLTFGFSQAYVRFYTRIRARGDETEVRRLNGMYLLLYLVISFLALALGLAFAANAGAVFSAGFTEGQVALARTLMSIMTANIALTLFSTVFDAYILAHEEFRFQQSRQLLTTLATPLIALLLLNLGMGAVGVAFAQLSVQAALLALNARYAVGALGMRFDVRRPDWRLLRAVAAFSGWIFANQVCDLVNQNVPNVMLGALTSASTVAVFAVSVQIRSVFYSLSTTMSNVFTPKINRIVAESDDNAALTRLMTRVGRYQAVLFCWVYGGFALLGRFFVERWAGPGFADAYWLVLAMVAPLVVPLTQNTGIEIQRAKNMHRPRSVAMLIGAAFNVAFTAAAAPFLGCWAPAVGYIACIALCNGIFMNWYYQKRVGLDMVWFWRRNLPVLIAGAAVTLACLAGTALLPVGGWLPFLAWGAAYTALYAVALWLAVLDPGERSAVASRLPFLR